ncbi:transglycosylase SLT domain-containing protein [Granulicella sibirica]|uniref:Soluble lytic murein transglycosylase n=1 Tax=Granulicella sibirica TaxID=2479048 RepID=A0A4Q0SYU5_9BACT|nr:transglycosylase SLT domain-containing protein [Granulicella sibirica]RXH56443.1 Soluble lytic murein transglycosylase precursor [Granulicella sibirica]
MIMQCAGKQRIGLGSWLGMRAGALLISFLAFPAMGITEVKKPVHAHSKAKTAKTGTKTSTPKKGPTKAGAKEHATKGGKSVATKHPRLAGHADPVAAPVATAQSIRLTSAFLASSQLRPMAQQLASTRSAAAYDGVSSYAKGHPGDGAATAFLALGHAYMLDKRYPEAANTYRQAGASGDALSDYADYLGAQAALAAGHGADAYGLLDHFDERHPGSIFVANAPVLLANLYLQQNNPQGALNVLTPIDGSPQSVHSDFRYALGRAYQMNGDTARATPVFRTIFLSQPLTAEASQARTQLAAMNVPLTAGERKIHADALYNAKRYGEASQEYHALEKNDPGLSQGDKDALEIYAAVCDLKLKRLSRHDVEKLPQTDDDSAALKLYLLSELARNENDVTGNDRQVAELVSRFPASRWTEEGLYSGGNMHLLKHEQVEAISNYQTLVRLFPKSTYAPSAHWRAAWMSYRLRRYTDAARLMDEQITMYPAGIEAPSALYWRGRLYEDEGGDFGQAANYYRSLTTNYVNFYYAVLARQRLAVIGAKAVTVSAAAPLASVRTPTVPELTGELPENDPHLIKARLLANAALNEYIGPEIQASATSGQWGALAQAEIYASFGEYTRALQSMKHSGISFFSIPMSQVPSIYWRLLFPQPYWSDLVADSQRNGLDPHLVASLIRQESEFNAGAISPANAYGLMQLLPSVGKAAAKKNGLRGFDARQLFNPSTNLLLGTTNLREVLDRFGGQAEYALAAYNAGDTPVRRWLSTNDYKDVAEYVESIPYSETREYVQAILRNREMYRALYPVH